MLRDTIPVMKWAHLSHGQRQSRGFASHWVAHDPLLLCAANSHLFDTDGKKLFKRGNQHINEILPALEKTREKADGLKFKQLKNSR